MAFGGHVCAVHGEDDSFAVTRPNFRGGSSILIEVEELPPPWQQAVREGRLEEMPRRAVI